MILIHINTLATELWLLLHIECCYMSQCHYDLLFGSLFSLSFNTQHKTFPFFPSFIYFLFFKHTTTNVGFAFNLIFIFPLLFLCNCVFVCVSVFVMKIQNVYKIYRIFIFLHNFAYEIFSLSNLHQMKLSLNSHHFSSPILIFSREIPVKNWGGKKLWTFESTRHRSDLSKNSSPTKESDEKQRKFPTKFTKKREFSTLKTSSIH